MIERAAPGRGRRGARAEERRPRRRARGTPPPAIRSDRSPGNEALPQFEAALHAGAMWVRARERQRTSTAMLIHELRLAALELGRRAVAAGTLPDAKLIFMLFADELPTWVADPASLRRHPRRARAGLPRPVRLRPAVRRQRSARGLEAVGAPRRPHRRARSTVGRGPHRRLRLPRHRPRPRPHRAQRRRGRRTRARRDPRRPDHRPVLDAAVRRAPPRSWSTSAPRSPTPRSSAANSASPASSRPSTPPTSSPTARCIEVDGTTGPVTVLEV